MRSKLVFVASILFLVGITPCSQAQWLQAGGPYGGTISAIAKNSSFLFVATGSGVFRSSDNGATWLPSNSGLQYPLSFTYLPFTSLCIAANGNTIFAADSYGIFESIDNGDRWVRVDSSLISVMSLRIAGSNIFAITNSGLFRSADSGSHWQNASSGLPSSNISCFETDGSFLYAGTGNGVFRSSDNGTSWTPANSGIANLFIGAISMSAGNIWVDALNNSTFSYSVFCSTDGGMSWNPANSGLSTNAPAVFTSSGTTDFSALDDSIFISSNGNGWTYTGGTLPTTRILSFLSASGDLFAGTEYSGLFQSADLGVTWNAINHGITNTQIPSLCSFGNALFVGTNELGIQKTTDSGTTWTVMDSGLKYNYTYQSMLGDGTELFAGTDGTGAFRSTDTGESWTLAGGFSGGLFGQAINQFIAKNGTLFAALEGGISRSTDNGANWSSVTDANPVLSTIFVKSLDTMGPNVIAGIEYSKISGTTGGVFWTSDLGADWTRGTGISDTTSVKALANIESKVLAGTISGIFVSADNGESWTSSGASLYATSFAVSGEYAFATNGSNVLLSTDTGKTWNDVSTGLNNVLISALIVNGDNLYAGSGANGVWRRPISEMISSGNEVVGADRIAPAIMVYPNPASNSATVNFSTAASEPVTITIYNLLGKEIARPYDGEVSAGNHSIRWDAGTVTNGAYLCQLKFGKALEHVPILVAK